MYSSVPRSVNLSTTILYPGNHRVFAFLDVRRFLFESLTIKQALKEMPTFHANQKKKNKNKHIQKKKKRRKSVKQRGEELMVCITVQIARVSTRKKIRLAHVTNKYKRVCNNIILLLLLLLLYVRTCHVRIYNKHTYYIS